MWNISIKDQRLCNYSHFWLLQHALLWSFVLTLLWSLTSLTWIQCIRLTLLCIMHLWCVFMSEMSEMWSIHSKVSNVTHVRDVRDESNCIAFDLVLKYFTSSIPLTYKHVFAHNFLNIQWIFNLKKVLESWELELFNNTIKSYVCWTLFQSLTSPTCFIIHSIWWYGWKALTLSFLKLFSDWKPVEY